MIKKTILLLLGLGLWTSGIAQASEYGLCINKSRGDWRMQVTCNQDETRRLMREIANTYARIARDPRFGKINNGQTALAKQLKDWQAYRDSYCAYYEISKSGYGDEEYQRTNCLMRETQKQLKNLEALISNINTDIE